MSKNQPLTTNIFNISPLIRITLLLLYAALTIPLPFLAEATAAQLDKILDEVRTADPSSLEVITLLLKPEALEKEIDVKYVGFEIPNKFVVGYGLDYNGYGRNLKDIHQITPS